MEKTQTSSARRSFNFRLSCDAGNTGKFQAESDSSWLRVAQRIRRSGKEKMWDSVTIECTSEQDGTLILRVIVFNPDWQEPLQIASIRSRPQDLESLTPLGCKLDYVTL